ncbi:cyclic-di-AMP receptor [Christensenellaceae bacterium OttesenSCG-928-M15]|nr:cyclic-di-AMP receptor [Christensenellaceae bacterium OttesenSCG-928-M15]
MKLLFAIIQTEDEKVLTRELVEHSFSVTRVATSGGFLKSGNATLMIGVEKDCLEDALRIIKEKSHRRKSLMAAPPFPTHGVEHAPIPIEVNVGGATVFVVDVEQFHKY